MPAPAVMVHDPDHVRRILDLAGGRAVALLSPPAAGLTLGPLAFRALLARGGAEPAQAILDCGDSPGAVLAGLRAGFTTLVCHPGPATDRLAALLATRQARLLAKPPPAVDPVPEEALADWLDSWPAADSI